MEFPMQTGVREEMVKKKEKKNTAAQNKNLVAGICQLTSLHNKSTQNLVT